MTARGQIEVRPALPGEARRALDLVMQAAAGPASEDALLHANLGHLVVAARAGEYVGLCAFILNAGRCAALLPPRLVAWDEALAARLIRAAGAQAHRQAGALLIQALLDPDGPPSVPAAYEQAGLERLATLVYMRRPVAPGDRRPAAGAELEWRRYGRLRHREFARAIEATYEGTLDCPRLAGLRPVADAIATHRSTGTFSPKAWHVARLDGRAVGVELVNNLQGRGELIYLGVVAEARRRGIGRALLSRAIRDTADMGLPQMGLAADAANAPALHLYEGMGFKEVRRRLAYFVPKENLASLAAEGPSPTGP
jgi:ribosomal protein S18 acetylase RimI-like enzyme